MGTTTMTVRWPHGLTIWSAHNERLSITINGHCISWCYASVIILLLMGDSIMNNMGMTEAL